jgi:hypothetical protein
MTLKKRHNLEGAQGVGGGTATTRVFAGARMGALNTPRDRPTADVQWIESELVRTGRLQSSVA